MEMKDLENRFNYHVPNTEEKKQAHENVRNMCLRLAIDLDKLVPEGREKSLAITSLEDVMFWANAGIARSDG